MINAFLHKYVELLEAEHDDAGEYLITLVALGMTPTQIYEWTTVILHAKRFNLEHKSF